MAIQTEMQFAKINAPANLRINDQIKRYREHCRRYGCTKPYHHFAFGQSLFPPPPAIVNALSAHAAKHDYLPAAGLPELRKVIAKYYRHHFHLTCCAEQVVVSPGSKEMIAMILAVVEGAVLIPIPSWVSYLPQAQILKKEVVSLPTSAEQERFFRQYCPLILEGIANISLYISEVSNHQLPQHP